MFSVDVHVEWADAYSLETLSGLGGRGVVSEHVSVKPPLSLLSQDIVHPGEHDNQLVACIRRLVRETGIVRRLVGLNMPDDEAATIPAVTPLRILDLLHDQVGRRIDCLDRCRGPLLVLQEKVGITTEKPSILLSLAEVPRDVALFVGQGGWSPNRNHQPSLQLRDDGVDLLAGNRSRDQPSP